MLRTKAWDERELALFYCRNLRREGGENPCHASHAETWGIRVRRRARLAVELENSP